MPEANTDEHPLDDYLGMIHEASIVTYLASNFCTTTEKRLELQRVSMRLAIAHGMIQQYLIEHDA